MGKKSRRDRLKAAAGGSGDSSRAGRPMPQTRPLDRAPDGKPVHNAAIMVAKEDIPPCAVVCALPSRTLHS